MPDLGETHSLCKLDDMAQEEPFIATEVIQTLLEYLYQKGGRLASHNNTSFVSYCARTVRLCCKKH